MVEPTFASPGSRPRARPTSAPTILAILVAMWLASLPGCGFTPRAKMDECQRVAQNLRAENSRLRDVALDLRSRNQDLNARADDDAKRITVQAEAVEQLEESVHGYQSEREKMAAAYENLERQVRLALNAETRTSAREKGLESFAKAHPGWSYDAMRRTLLASTDSLFETGRDQFKADAETTVKALASELSSGDGKIPPIEIAAFGAPDSSVRRAGFQQGDEKADDPKSAAKTKARFLAAARAARVRDRLVDAGGLEPAGVRLVSGANEPGAVGTLPPPRNDPGEVPERRVEIRLPAEYFRLDPPH